MGEGNGKTRILITVLKVIGAIAVAGLGAYGSIKSTQASSEITQAIEILKATADRIDVKVIPRMQKELDRQQGDDKTLVEICAKLRERVAHLEGRLGRVAHLERRPRPTATAAGMGPPAPEPEAIKLDKILKRKSDKIPDVDFDGVQMMVQKAAE